MVKKKILIISYTYPPANAPAAWRPYYFAKYMDKEKYDVSVLTCSNQDSSLGFDNNFDENLDRINSIKIKAYNINRNALQTQNNYNKISVLGSIKKFIFSKLYYFIYPDKGIFWLPNVIKHIKKYQDNFNDVDVILSTSPLFTNHLIGLFLKKRIKANFIADFRDYHYLENWQRKRWGLKKLLHKKIESKVIKKANKVLYISDAMRNIYADYYTRFKDKMETIYNGYDATDYRPPNIMDKLSGNKLTIFYAGSFYKGIRSPFPLFETLDVLWDKKLIAEESIQINIAGSIDNELKEQISKYKSAIFVRYLGNIPREEVIKRYKGSHLLWLIVGMTKEHYTGLPLKFFEYVASNRFIINFAPDVSEPSKIINNYHLGWNFDTTNFNLQHSVQKFEEVLQKFNDGKLLQSLNNDKLVHQFSRENQTKELQTIIDNL